ncbi:F5/8 type C domain protein [Ceratocystis lukuohia]|uniref:F5/8 type C domain protein n=1 Tax=Ceratocystis lukuohia TaxID=2019550 RepID=A0ABR4MNQ8_9PEZI
MWGLDASNMESESLYHAVNSLIDNRGINITHVLSYTEPGRIDNGGSSISTRVGARGWTTRKTPMRELGVKVGLPAYASQYYSLT